MVSEKTSVILVEKAIRNDIRNKYRNNNTNKASNESISEALNSDEGFIVQCEGLDEATGEKGIHHAMETKIRNWNL